MKVTPLNKKFGKYAPGDVFELPNGSAKLLIKIGKLAAVETAALGYQTRMMSATSSVTAAQDEPAPYGYKADGTPRKRPGRPAAKAE